MEHAWRTGQLSREQYKDYLRTGNPYYLGGQSPGNSSAPIHEAASTAGSSKSSDIYSSTFAQSPALKELWLRASSGATDWDAARNSFWRLVRTDSGKAAESVRQMLGDAGFVFRAGSDTTTAPVLAAHIPAFSEDQARQWAGSDSDRAAIVDRLMDARAAGSVPKNDFSDRVLSIDHVKARANGGSTFDPANLRFELLRDNSFKGNR